MIKYKEIVLLNLKTDYDYKVARKLTYTLKQLLVFLDDNQSEALWNYDGGVIYIRNYNDSFTIKTNGTGKNIVQSITKLPNEVFINLSD